MGCIISFIENYKERENNLKKETSRSTTLSCVERSYDDYYLKVCKPAECSICLEPLLKNVYALPCAHVYHEKCIREWMKKSHSCPICYNPVFY